MEKFKGLSDEALATMLSEKQTEATALVEAAGDTPTDEQAEQAVALTAEITDIETETAARAEAATQRGDAFAGLRSKVTAAAEDEPVDEDEDEPDEEEPVDEEIVETEPATEPVAAATTTKVAATLAKKTSRPKPPQVAATNGYTISAGAETGFNVGQPLEGIGDITKAAVARLRGFTPPNGDGKSENLQKFGVANIRVEYPEDLMVTDRHSDGAQFETLMRAADETRLDGGNLVAAGGWCAPSETLYDLAADESLDGMVSVPEIGVSRGGVRWTPGPQFADFYANAGFLQTETQAIAGTAKPCYQVTCPSFTEVRLDAAGLCIKVPILTEAAYPELVNRFTSGTLIAHQHFLNATKIAKMVALSGTVRNFTGVTLGKLGNMGSSVHDAMSVLEFVANQRRQTYRLAFNRSMEVVLPYWVKSVMRDDLAARNGVGTDAITDADVAAHFAARNLNVQYVYDWQDLPLVDVGGTATIDERNEYPVSFDAMIYPAGTFVVGVSDVINLSAVYDAASLATNMYTGLFVERGLLVANMQYSADLVRIAVENSGRTGRQDLGIANA